jgi:hypothetical protein
MDGTLLAPIRLVRPQGMLSCGVLQEVVWAPRRRPEPCPASVSEGTTGLPLRRRVHSGETSRELAPLSANGLLKLDFVLRASGVWWRSTE